MNRPAIAGSILLVLLVCLAVLAAAPALAQNSVTPGALTLESTFECVAVVAAYTGDDNADGSVSLTYRPQDAAEFLQAHDMVRLAGGRWAGSIVGLTPGLSYDVRVEFSDPDGVDGTAAVDGQVWTRADGVPSGSGNTYHVSALTGSDGADGSEGSPWATIQHAADTAAAGDTIIVHEGIYREEIEIQTGGEPGNPVTFRAAEGESVIIDGSDESLAEPGGGEWTNHAGSVWTTVLDGPTGFVAEDGRRLYHYEDSLADLESLVEGYAGGWFYDDASGRLYVRTREDDDPDGHAMQVGQIEHGFVMDGLHDIVIEGFEIRFQASGPYGNAVYIRHSSRVWVRHCVMHSSQGGVSIRFEDSEDNVIEWNEIYDTEITSWDWDDVKAHDVENSAISVEGGSGTVVRYNVVHGIFNGIALSLWGDLENEAFNHNVDVYGNRLYDIGDDGIEPEGAAINMRIWGNVMTDHLNCISLAPITVGPLYAWRNVMAGFFSGSFKVSIDSDGPCFLYHNTVYTDVADTNAFSPSGPYANMTFRNNILGSSRYVIEDMGENFGGVTWDYDNLYTTDTGRFVKWDDVRYDDLDALRTGTGFELGGISQTSAFTDAAGLDFSLLETSPEVDAGLVIPNFNDGFCGAGPDMGAYEFITEGCETVNPDPPPEIPESLPEADPPPDTAPDAVTDSAPDTAADGDVPDGTDASGEDSGNGGSGCGCSFVR